MFDKFILNRDNTRFNALSFSALLLYVIFVLFISSCQTGTDNPTDGSGSTTINAASKKIHTVDGTFGPTDKPYGVSYDNWSVKWWQWVLTVPVLDFSTSPPTIIHPILADDADAQKVFLNGQNDPNVIMLGGTFDGHTADRTIEYSGNKALFFPFVNIWSDTTWDNGFPPLYGTIKNLLRAYQPRDVINTLKLSIDGTVIDPNYLSEFYFISGQWSYPINANSLWVYFTEYPYIGTVVKKAASVGYWMMVKPLSKGKHTLYFHWGPDPNGFAEDITYHITVD
jgi:hypothetical protein